MQTKKMRVLAFLVPLALFVFFSSRLQAQTFRGSINGTITDSSGASVAGAKVTAIDTATSVVHETVSSGAGEFSFNDLPQSDYTVTAEASGFQVTKATGVQVQAGKVYTLPIKLSIAQQATTVEVAADALSLDTTTTTQVTVLDGKALQNTPLNGRDFTQLLGTSPAFSGYNNTGSVNGMRNDQVNYTIDGTDNNDLYLNANAVNQGSISGIAGVVYPIDALDEYSLQTVGSSETERHHQVRQQSNSRRCLLLQSQRGAGRNLAIYSCRRALAAAAQPELWRFGRRPHLARPHFLIPSL
jgi:hypothetical protein